MINNRPALLAVSRQQPGRRCRALLESFAETGGESLHVAITPQTKGHRWQSSEFKCVQVDANNPASGIAAFMVSRSESFSIVCEDDAAIQLCAKVGLKVDFDLRHLPQASELLSNPLLSLAPKEFHLSYPAKKQSSNSEIQVLVDGLNAEHSQLLTAELRRLNPTLNVRQRISTDSKNDVAQAGIIIGSDWQNWAEYALLEQPIVFVGDDPTTRRVASRLADAVACLNMTGRLDTSRIAAVAKSGTNLLDSPAQRQEISTAARNLVDPHAPKKLTATLQGKSLWLRNWQVDDIRQIWNWNNEPVARAAAVLPRSMTWDSHCLWFEKAQTSDQARGFIATTVSGEPIGYACCQLRQGQAEMEVVIDPLFRGQGFDLQLIEATSQQLMRSTNVESIHVYLKHGRVVSLRAFEQAGFVRKGSLTRQETMTYHFELSRKGASNFSVLTNLQPSVLPSEQVHNRL